MSVTRIPDEPPANRWPRRSRPLGRPARNRGEARPPSQAPVKAGVVLGPLWSRRTKPALLAAVLWALTGWPAAIDHVRGEPDPYQPGCATQDRLSVGYGADPTGAPPIAWCFSADGPIRELAVRDDAVYLASASGRLTALDRERGEVRWETAEGVASGAIVAAPGVVIGGGVAAVTAWNLAGGQLWTAPTPGPVTALAARVLGDAYEVYVACADGTILAIDGATGTLRWQTLSPVPGAELAVSGQEVYAFNSPREITIAVLDAGSGDVRGAWIYDLGPQTHLTGPILAGRTLVAGYEVLSDGPAPRTGGIVGMDPLAGAFRWNVPLDAPVQVSPIDDGGVTHVVGLNGHLVRLEPDTGNRIGPLEIIESRAAAQGDAERMLALGDGTIYVSQPRGEQPSSTAHLGVVTATDATGAALWRFRLSDLPTQPVALAGDDVYIPDGESLYAILASDPATPEATPVQ